MTTKACSSCHNYLIGLDDEQLCPKCENQTELPKASRKRGDKEKHMTFNQLFEAWKSLRKQREQWRKGEERAAQDRMNRERLEREKRFLLIALSAFDTNQDILRQFVTTRNQLNVMTAERDRLKDANEYAIKRMIEVGQENTRLEMENLKLRLNNKVIYREVSQSSSFTKEMWRRFTQLCHPDKHDGSVAATEATRWLLENRP